MMVTIELRTGPRGSEFVTKSDIQRNIDSLRRVRDGKGTPKDIVTVNDTISILEGIKEKLYK